MQNLEGPKATPQVATVARHQNAVAGKFVIDGGTNLQGKTEKEMELDEFEAFKSFRAMRKLQSERRVRKEKVWDQFSVHTDQTEDSSEEKKESDSHEKRLSKDEKDVDWLPYA